ncbi:MAG: hypothetical protein V1720_22020 [bacterium]
MKKLLIVIGFFSCLLSSYNLNAQLLNAGDAVVTMSGNVWTNNSTPGTNFVLEIFKTNNTSAAPIGAAWTMTPAFYNTYSYKDPNWIRSKMGNIFGVTIDNNRNIYVAATGFYGAQVSGISTGQIWKVDGITGAVTAFKDLHSGGQNAVSLGNVKYFNGYLYAANLADGKIYAINVTNPSANYPSFDPGGTADTRKPHGIAIRNVGGNPRLFFSLNEFNSATTAIHSIGISGSSFIGSETLEISGFASNADPITDLAFNHDFKRIIMAERTTSSWSSTTGAHLSKVYEYELIGTVWTNINPNYKIGSISTYANAAGGISFSKFLIGENRVLSCDSTIWATSDAIFLSSIACYGMIGFPHSINSGYQNGVNIDFDNDLVQQDKRLLGDVEVCDTTFSCGGCECGSLGEFPINISFNPHSRPLKFGCGDSYTFNQNSVSGILNANYNCIGNCASSLSWQLINSQTNAVVSSGTSLPINLSQFNNLSSGSYIISLTPICGEINCPPCEFNINIISDPPSCCPDKTEIKIEPKDASYNSSANPLWGVYMQSFVVSSSEPMSEIRIDVEHFELNSKDPECIPCKNMPRTWGSLLGASLNGNGFTKPVNSTPFNTSVYSNPRELIYKPGSLITLNSSNLTVNIAFPKTSDIDCCELTANICLKFTFKDKDCRECTYIYCNSDIPLIKSKEGNPNGIKIENFSKEIKRAIL